MYTRDDLLKYIKNTLDDKDNIFLHGIETESHSEKEKLQSIIQNGLECNYFTIFRTVRELGKLEKVTATIYEDNKYSRNTVEKLGFKKTGTFKKSIPFKKSNYIYCYKYKMDKEYYFTKYKIKD